MGYQENNSIEKLFSLKNMQSIVDSIGSLINHKVVICNRDGIIIAATNRSRLGVSNHGVRRMLENNEDMYVVEGASDADDADNEFLPGVNQPLWYKGTAVGSLGITGNPSEVKVFCKIVRSFVQQQLLELDIEKDKASQKRMLSSFVYSWVSGDASQDSAEFEIRSRALNIDIYNPRVICIISACSSLHYTFTADQLNQHIMQYVENYLEVFDHQHIVSLLGQEIIVLLNTDSTTLALNTMTALKAQLEQKLSIDCAIGIGSTCNTLDEVKLSYEAARLACNTSKNTLKRDIFVFGLFDLELMISTVDRHHKQRIFNYVFRNYESSLQIDESIKLLQVYIDSNRSIEQTAKVLCLHKNTVQYRLNKIHEQTGYDPRVARDLTFLHTVTLIYKMGIRKQST